MGEALVENLKLDFYSKNCNSVFPKFKTVISTAYAAEVFVFSERIMSSVTAQLARRDYEDRTELTEHTLLGKWIGRLSM